MYKELKEVFEVDAECGGRSLNDAIHVGSELEMTFCKCCRDSEDLLPTVGDICGMMFQVVMWSRRSLVSLHFVVRCSKLKENQMLSTSCVWRQDLAILGAGRLPTCGV